MDKFHHHNYLNCKQITTAINRATVGLINKANHGGVYENFGQVEVRNIKDNLITHKDFDEFEKYTYSTKTSLSE